MEYHSKLALAALGATFSLPLSFSILQRGFNLVTINFDFIRPQIHWDERAEQQKTTRMNDEVTFWQMFYVFVISFEQRYVMILLLVRFYFEFSLLTQTMWHTQKIPLASENMKWKQQTLHQISIHILIFFSITRHNSILYTHKKNVWYRSKKIRKNL